MNIMIATVTVPLEMIMTSMKFAIYFPAAMLLSIGVADAKTFELHQHASASTLQQDCGRVGGEFHNSGGISSCMSPNGNVVTCSKPDGNKCYGTTPILTPSTLTTTGESLTSPSSKTRNNGDGSFEKNSDIPKGALSLGARSQ